MAKLTPQALVQIIKESASAWVEDRAASMGAALAFYSAFSLAPLLIIAIAIAGLAFGEEAARGAITSQLSGLMGTQGASAVQTMLTASKNQPEHGILASIIAVFTLWLGATSVFVELQDDLDRIWRAKPSLDSGVINFIRTRLLSFGMILGIGFLLLVSLIVSSLLAAFTESWGHFLPSTTFLLYLINFIISFVVTTVLFAMIYKLLPNVEIDWHDVWIGSAVTALLFNIGRAAIGLYLGQSATASTYGAAGAFVVLLLWLYYSAQIFLLGAEFTWIYANRFGSRAGQTDSAATQATEAKPTLAVNEG